MERPTLSKILLPYRLLPFSAKIRIRNAVDNFSYSYRVRKTERTDRSLRSILAEISTFAYKPRISVVMPVYNTQIVFLNAAIRSVCAQCYENWELCICDDASTDETVRTTLRKWQARDSRIKVHYSTVNEHISGASNHALALATGDFVGLLDHDDAITPDALFENVKLLQDHPDADMIYSDEDKLDAQGKRLRPFSKPEWSPDLMRRMMYTCHFGVYRKRLIDEIGGFRKGFEGSQDHDLVLRLTERTSRVHHIPKILYHWRMAPGSAAASTDAKPYAYAAAKKAIAEHLERKGIRGSVLDSSQPGRYQVVYESPDTANRVPTVSVIVPSYNHARFLRKRMDTILAQTFQDFELILLDDCSTDDSRSILSSYSANPHVTTVQFNKKNSGSTYKQWNRGVCLARGKYIWIAESDDYADPRFLERLIPVLDAEPKVVYAYCRSWRVLADGSTTGFADNYLKPLDLHRWTADHIADGHEECRKYFVRVNLVPNASAVLFRKSVFEEVGGADESLRLCGDWKLWASLALTGEIAYIGKPLNYFRFHEASVRSKTLVTRTNVSESLDVVSWILRRVKARQKALQNIHRWQPEAWTPVLMSMRVALDVKRRILRAAREIDPHPIRHSIRPALGTIRLKFLRHWRTFSPSIRPARELWAWWKSKAPKSPGVEQLTSAIASVSAFERAAVENDSEAPIFLFSTGMRTGSTLLQRILITDSRLFLWGEPMGEMTVVSRIARMVGNSLSSGFQESWQRQPSPDSLDLTKSWIAHLNPSADNFRLGLRNFFDTWLGCPARRNGFARWGFKEVRLDATDATLLYWLYPNAKFLLLTRHPYDCYRSFTDAKWQEPSFMRHPDVPINSAASFAREWNRIAISWSELPADFPSMLIKYEDLISGNFDFRNLESWLGLKLNESEALSEKVGRTAFRARLNVYERLIVSREAASGMSALGYSKRGN